MSIRITNAPGEGNGGPSVDIADFIFTAEEGQSIISLPGDKGMRIEAGTDSDLYLTAGDDLYLQTLGTGDDIHINAADDIRFSAGEENETAHFWRMDSEGNLQLPGDGYISNPIDSSGDPSTPYNDTMHLVPDGSIESDQYIILDPTAPNHIHIRAGGDIDESGADLILGGEKNNVVVSDSARDVFINTRPDTVINSYTNLNEVNNINFIVSSTADIGLDYVVNVDGTDYIVNSVTPDGELIVVTASGAVFTAGQSYTFTYDPPFTNSWEFGSNGYLYGPADGGLKVLGINNPAEEQHVFVTSGDKVMLSGINGEFLNDSTVPSNQIATIGDISNAVSDVIIYNPVWSSIDLAFTGTPAVGYYVKVGRTVTVQIDVEFDNVTNFGTGQYSITLPFNSAYHTDVYGGSVHDVGGITNHYSIKGHLVPSSNVCSLWYISGSSQDQEFDHNSPINLTTADKFHMSFTYICE